METEYPAWYCLQPAEGIHTISARDFQQLIEQRLQWASLLGPRAASGTGFQSAWRQECNNRYGVQSGISAIISGNKWVAAKSIWHMPLQPVNSDVSCLNQSPLIIPKAIPQTWSLDS